MEYTPYLCATNNNKGMGYASIFTQQQRTINNCPFELVFTQCVFDTLGHEICVRGAAKTWLYSGTNDHDDPDDYRVNITKAEICYDYTAPTNQNPNPYNRFWPVGDLEAELGGTSQWDEI